LSSESIWHAVWLGLIEGLTEFIPVSSTGHLILMVEVLEFDGPPGRVFEVAIQMGAILAVCLLYVRRLWRVATTLHTDPGSQRFAAGVTLAFLPAAIVGVLAHGYIKAVLFSPFVVAISLVVGGVIILIMEPRLRPARVARVEDMRLRTALGVGCFQVLAMIPGVSRSGATIVGALLLGVERRAAAEFSFFLAIPTMLGAATYDLHKNWHDLSLDGGLLIGVGFVAAFAAGGLVVRFLVDFVGRHGFAPFGWYRIAVGGSALVLLLT
jgi:undecaprenyl-diphosphatase